jgi:hypothetical protein
MLTALLLSGSGSAGVEESRADWNKNIITAFGVSSIRIDYSGTPVSIHGNDSISITEARRGAYETAKEIAMEKMISILKNIRVDQDNTIGSMLEHDSFTRRRLYAALERIQFEELPAGFVSSACRAKLSMGDITASLPFVFPADDFPERIDVPIETAYSGLIIDLRGLETKPMLFPVVYNRNGLEIISRNNINGAETVKYGMVTYAIDEKDAKLNKRVGAHPLYVTAIDENRGCPVLSEKDVRRIFSSRKTMKALKECRIVFIIDKE